MLNIDLQGHHSNCPVWYKAFHCPWKKQRGLCYYYSDKIFKKYISCPNFFYQHGKFYLFLRRGYSWYKNDDLKIMIIKTEEYRTE